MQRSDNLTKEDLEILKKGKNNPDVKGVLEKLNNNFPEEGIKIKVVIKEEGEDGPSFIEKNAITKENIEFVLKYFGQEGNLTIGERNTLENNKMNYSDIDSVNYTIILNKLTDYAAIELKKLNLAEQSAPPVQQQPVASVPAKPEPVKATSLGDKELHISKAMRDAILAYQKEHSEQDATPLAYLDLAIRGNIRGNNLSRPYDKFLTSDQMQTLEGDINKFEKEKEELKEIQGDTQSDNVENYTQDQREYLTKKNEKNFEEANKRIEFKQQDYNNRKEQKEMEEKLLPKKMDDYNVLAKKLDSIFKENEWKFDDETVNKVKGEMGKLPGLQVILTEFDEFSKWLDAQKDKYPINQEEIINLKKAIISGYLFNVSGQSQIVESSQTPENKQQIAEYLKKVALFFNRENTKDDIITYVNQAKNKPWNANTYYLDQYDAYAPAYTNMKNAHNKIVTNSDYLSLDKAGQKVIMNAYFEKCEQGKNNIYTNVAILNHKILETKPELATILDKINKLMDHYQKKEGGATVVNNLKQLLLDLKDKPLLNDEKSISKRLKTISTDYSKSQGYNNRVTRFFHRSTISKEIGSIAKAEKELSQDAPKQKK